MAEKDKEKKSAKGGGNPNVPAKAFGGAKDAGVTGFEYLFPGLSEGAFKGPSFSDFNVGGYGQGGGGEESGLARRRLELMTDLWRQGLEAQQKAQVRPAEEYEAQAKAQDPVKFAEQRRAASLADPFGPGGYFEGRRAADIMTPEEIMASQGPTAANQWASLRGPLTAEQKQNLQGPSGVKVAAQRGAGEFDPEELRRLNEQYRARRTYS
jgi:hypothetical protein